MKTKLLLSLAVLCLAGCSQAELATARQNASTIAGSAAKGAASAAEQNALNQIAATGKINTKQLETAAGAGAVQGAIAAIPVTSGT